MATCRGSHRHAKGLADVTPEFITFLHHAHPLTAIGIMLLAGHLGQGEAPAAQLGQRGVHARG